MSRRSRFRALFLVAFLAACVDRDLPTESSSANPSQPKSDGNAERIVPRSGADMWSDALLVVDSTQLALVSDRVDVEEGVYRFKILQEPARMPEAGEVIHGGQRGGFLRRVHEVSRSGDELTVKTFAAFWHEVINGGTYGFSAPLPHLGTPSATYTGDPYAAIPMPALDYPLDGLDLCALAAQLGHPFCGADRTLLDPGWVELNGRIDSLYIDSGSVNVSGNMDANFTVDPGGATILNTGRRPVFSPCDAYPNVTGCFSKVGAALQTFLAWVGIDPQVLPPLKMCIPGTPITVRPGSIFPFRLPTIRICKITDWGELPSFTPPFLDESTVVFYPTTIARVKVRAVGTAKLKLTIPIPNAAVTKCFDHGNGFFCLKAGLYMVVAVEVTTGAYAEVVATSVDVITLTWTPESEWTVDPDHTSHDFERSFDPDDAASRVGVRLGPAVQLEAELCFGSNTSRCQDQSAKDIPNASLVHFQLGIKGKASLGFFVDGVWTRDPLFNNWHIDVDGKGEFELEAGLTLPRLLIRLDKNTKRSWVWPFLEHEMADLHGTGTLRVVTMTGGTSPDPDGFTVTVARADTLPALADPVGQRVLKPNWGDTLSSPIGTVGTVDFVGAKLCSVFYTDAIHFGQQIGRRVGLNVPNFMYEFGCALVLADYNVTLSGVDDNCFVHGPRTHTVRLTTLKADTFHITCTSVNYTPGSLDVTATTTGFTLDPDGYRITLDGMDRGGVASNGKLTLTGLSPAAGRQVALTGVASNCTVTNGSARAVDIIAAQTAAIAFDIVCDPPAVPDQAAGSLQVQTTTTGASLDSDGYTLTINGVSAGAIASNGQLNVAGLAVGNSVIVLNGVAENCTVANGTIRDVPIPRNATTSLSYAITCTNTSVAGPTGNVRIQIVTSGVEIDPDGYQLRIDSSAIAVAVADTITYTELAVGSAQVTLAGVAPNCEVQGENPLSVTINTNATTQATVNVQCAATATIEAVTDTWGSEHDPDGYHFLIDGVDKGAMTSDGSMQLTGVIAGEHTITLDGVAANCLVRGEYPRKVDLTGGSSQRIRFEIGCIPAADLGALEVRIRWRYQKVPANFSFLINGVEKGQIGASDQLVVPLLFPGRRTVELDNLPAACQVAGKNPRQVTLVGKATERVTFEIVCGP